MSLSERETESFLLWFVREKELPVVVCKRKNLHVVVCERMNAAPSPTSLSRHEYCCVRPDGVSKAPLLDAAVRNGEDSSGVNRSEKSVLGGRDQKKEQSSDVDNEASHTMRTCWLSSPPRRE